MIPSGHPETGAGGTADGGDGGLLALGGVVLVGAAALTAGQAVRSRRRSMREVVRTQPGDDE